MKLKKCISLLAAAVMACCCVQLTASAEESDFNYSIQEDGSVFVSCTNTSAAELTVPSSIDGYQVTGLAPECFYDCTSLTAVTLPDSLVSIGTCAFQGCTSLTEISIPASVTEIGKYAFDGTESLVSFTVAPENPSFQAPDGVLFDKDGTALIKYPEGSTAVSYSIPATCSRIEDWAFVGSQYLEKLDFGNVTEIGSDAFYYCVALKSAAIPEGVEILDGAVFGCCMALEQVTLPESLKAIGDECFYSCISLKKINLPEGLEKIGSYAFLDCHSLKSLTVPEDLITISTCCMGYREGSTAGSYVPQEDFTLYVKRNSVGYKYASSNEIPYAFGQAQNNNFYITCSVILGIADIALIIAIVIILKRRRSA